MLAYNLHMSFKIIHDIDSAKLEDYVPTLYKRQIRGLKFPEGSKIDLIQFPLEKDDVIKGPLAEKAIEKLEESINQIVAIGGCFTSDAILALYPANAQIISLKDFFWTDKNYNSIRVKINK